MENSIIYKISLAIPTNKSIKVFSFLNDIISNSSINSDQYQFNKYLPSFIRNDNYKIKRISCDLTPSGLIFFSNRQFYNDNSSILIIS